MKVQFLKAGKGDSIWLSWEFEGESESMLVDTGTPGTYSEIKHLSSKFGKLSAIIVTHVDYDHVGGIIKMLDDPSCPIKDEFILYVNSASMILKKAPGEKVDYKHGIQLDTILKEKNFLCKPLYIVNRQPSEHNFKGLKIILLSPTEALVDEFLKRSNAVEIQESYLSENSSVNEKVSRKDLGDNVKISDLFDIPESYHNPEEDLINSCSIAFIAEHDDKKWLMLGDANPKIIEEQLFALGISEENKLKVDFVKLAHHGCHFNTSSKLLKMIDCSKYVISTNGSGPYYHPDKQTIAKLIQYASRDSEGFIDIFLNYPLNRTLLTDEEKKEYKVRIQNVNAFN